MNQCAKISIFKVSKKYLNKLRYLFLILSPPFISKSFSVESEYQSSIFCMFNSLEISKYKFRIFKSEGNLSRRIRFIIKEDLNWELVLMIFLKLKTNNSTSNFCK